MLLALLALLLLSLLGLYLALNAVADVRISDNLESQVRAKYAALAGLSHARASLRGLDFSRLLSGPDGTYDSGSGYLAQARTYDFRNPVSWATVRSIDILDPEARLAGIADDGILSAGGTVLIPPTGIALAVPNPYGAGTVTNSRYFVKVTDNNGEATELVSDPADNPFIDGDGVVLVRSMGVAQTFRELVGLSERLNSVVVFEARFRRRSTFDLKSPLVILGNNVDASFTGGSLVISGGPVPAIGTIDTANGDAVFPDQILRAAAAGTGSITGGGLPAPSVQDITGSVSLNPDQTLLLDPGWLLDFVTREVPQGADYTFNGDQTWGAGAPYIGSFDITRPAGDPAQDPRVTVVDGNLTVEGGVSGGGLLLVRGDFSCTGSFSYAGLVLVIGSGNIDIRDLGGGFFGGLFVANLRTYGGTAAFGTPGVSIGGISSLTANTGAVSMAIRLLPASQLGCREVTSTMDPP